MNGYDCDFVVIDDDIESISEKNYFRATIVGKGRNEKLALDAHGVDLKYMISWIRGDVVESTEPNVYKSLEGDYIATSELKFERRTGKKYRR